MKFLTKLTVFLAGFALLSFGQIENFDFKTMVTLDGKSHNLHNLLESGKSVYLQMMFNG